MLIENRLIAYTLLALLVALCGMAVSYTQACGLLSAVTGRSDAQLLSVKMLLVALALALTLLASCAMAESLDTAPAALSLIHI